MNLDRARALLTYEPLSGAVTTKATHRLLQPDLDGYAQVYDNQAKKQHRIKLDKLAYMLAFGKVPRKDQRILHKNMQECDNRIVNLGLVSRSLFRQIKEAYRNLTEGIDIAPHEQDQFSFYLYWYEDGKKQRRIVEDIVSVRKLALRLKLRYSKLLSKYCVFD